jgi:hypothetical protein
MMRGTIFSHAEIHQQGEKKTEQYDDWIIEARWILGDSIGLAFKVPSHSK